ncbi:hypothetical protein [Subtercola sp. YIM 133946]|uniref:hypothetical protein n=1 Tax=Subtercola sp. YIM 133946 TaxID=3118909 RepID=UPI002F9598DE
MRTKKEHKPTIRESGGVGNWLNRRLFPYLGPPPLGPIDTESAESKARRAQAGACPLCGAPMSTHVVDPVG